MQLCNSYTYVSVCCAFQEFCMCGYVLWTPSTPKTYFFATMLNLCECLLKQGLSCAVEGFFCELTMFRNNPHLKTHFFTAM